MKDPQNTVFIRTSVYLEAERVQDLERLCSDWEVVGGANWIGQGGANCLWGVGFAVFQNERWSLERSMAEEQLNKLRKTNAHIKVRVLQHFTTLYSTLYRSPPH